MQTAYWLIYILFSEQKKGKSEWKEKQKKLSNNVQIKTPKVVNHKAPHRPAT